MKKLLIFDWDDVIVLGAREGYSACYKECLKKLEISLPEKEFEKRILERWGQPVKQELELLLNEHPGKVVLAEEIFMNAFNGDVFINQLQILENLQVQLKLLSKKYTLSIASGNTRSMITKIMNRFQIEQTLFSKIITSHEVPKGKSKPDPYMLRDTLNFFDMSPKEAFYIGDSKGDIIMGKKANIDTIAVLTGNLDINTANKIHPDYIFKDIISASEFLLA